MSKPKLERVASRDDRTLPIFAEFDGITDRIRQRAYELFRAHGFYDGGDLEDWLTAEREVCWPSAELRESGEEFHCSVALAGFEADDLTVTATPDEIIVKAEQHRETSAPEKAEADAPETETVHWSDFHYENVYRHIGLPAEVDVDKVKAEFKHGLLTITAPKLAMGEALEPREIAVSTAA